MKKILILAATILVLLCGCQANEETNASDYGDDISKAQEIAVISPDTSEVIDTITDTEEIKDFVSALNLDQWELKTLPDEEVDSILAEDGEIDMHCDYCGNHYLFNAMDIAEIRNNASPADPQVH